MVNQLMSDFQAKHSKAMIKAGFPEKAGHGASMGPLTSLASKGMMKPDGSRTDSGSHADTRGSPRSRNVKPPRFGPSASRRGGSAPSSSPRVLLPGQTSSRDPVDSFAMPPPAVHPPSDIYKPKMPTKMRQQVHESSGPDVTETRVDDGDQLFRGSYRPPSGSRRHSTGAGPKGEAFARHAARRASSPPSVRLHDGTTNVSEGAIVQFGAADDQVPHIEVGPPPPPSGRRPGSAARSKRVTVSSGRSRGRSPRGSPRTQPQPEEPQSEQSSEEKGPGGAAGVRPKVKVFPSLAEEEEIRRITREQQAALDRSMRSAMAPLSNVQIPTQLRNPVPPGGLGDGRNSMKLRMKHRNSVAAAQHANRNMRARKAKEEQTKHLQRMFGRESGQSGARNDPLGSLTQSSLQPRSLTSEELREMSMENPEMAARELLWRRLTEMA